MHRKSGDRHQSFIPAEIRLSLVLPRDGIVRRREGAGQIALVIFDQDSAVFDDCLSITMD